MLGTGLGWTEMLVIAAVALIVVGPRDLPAMLRQLGRMVGTVRRMGNEFRREFNKMAAMDDMRDVRESLTNPLRNARAEIEREFNKTTSAGVQPSGVLKPDADAGESVVGAIRTKAGITDASHVAAKAEMKAALKAPTTSVAFDTVDVPTDLMNNSIAGTATTAPKAKPVRQSRTKTAAAKPAAAQQAKASAKSATAKTATAESKTTAKPKATAKAASAASAGTAAPKAAKAASIKAKRAKPASGATKPEDAVTKPAAKPARRRTTAKAEKA